MNLNDLDIKLFFFGEERCLSGHFYGPGTRKVYLIHYILAGKGQFKIGEETYNLSQGQGFLICPDVVSSYVADIEEPWQYTWMGFDGKDAAMVLEKAGLNVENPIFRFDTQGTVSRLISLSEMKSAFTPIHDMVKQSVLMEMLDSLMKGEASEQFSLPNVAEERENVYLMKSVKYIEQHYREAVTISSLSEQVDISRSYLYRLFKKAYDMSPQTYVIHYRIERAKQLLESTTIGIGEISESVGYKSQHAFSKAFRKVTGVSPKYYRGERNKRRKTKGEII